jgi:Sulfotransferase domain
VVAPTGSLTTGGRVGCGIGVPALAAWAFRPPMQGKEAQGKAVATPYHQIQVSAERERVTDMMGLDMWAESGCEPDRTFDRLRTDALFRLHCINRSTFNIRLLTYTNFDGFLITGQHCGTHWIKWMLSHALAHHYGVQPPRYMNNASSNDLIGHPRHPRIHPALPRIASSHTIPPYALQWSWVRKLRALPPYAVVIRDVRDVLISNFEKWRSQYGVPFSRYVAGDPWGNAYVCDVWWYIRFANRWGEVALRHPRETLVLCYEAFRTNPLGELRRLSEHFHLGLTDEDLKAGVAMGSKEIMVQHQDPAVSERPVRPDGQGETRFTPDNLSVVGDILNRHLLHDFGYDYFEEPRGFQIPEFARR